MSNTFKNNYNETHHDKNNVNKILGAVIATEIWILDENAIKTSNEFSYDNNELEVK